LSVKVAMGNIGFNTEAAEDPEEVDGNHSVLSGTSGLVHFQ
jgi:hypothetical protein